MVKITGKQLADAAVAAIPMWITYKMYPLDMAKKNGTLSTDGYASYVEGIPAITSEFPTYATGKTTHGSEMMTNFLELVGNILYRTVVRF